MQRRQPSVVRDRSCQAPQFESAAVQAVQQSADEAHPDAAQQAVGVGTPDGL